MRRNSTIDRFVTIDHGISLREMISAGKYDWVNPDIKAENFPIEDIGIKQFRTRVFEFSNEVSSQDPAVLITKVASRNATVAMKKEGFDPATHVHGLAFGAMFPDEQCQYSIACLGFVAHSARVVLCLFKDNPRRGLGLGYWGGDWDGRCWRFPRRSRAYRSLMRASLRWPFRTLYPRPSRSSRRAFLYLSLFSAFE